MCGICGIADRHTPPDLDLLRRMNARLFHRGPDQGGDWTDGEAALAMRRLAIIDLASGQQPIFNEDGSVVIVFNGEIYNFPDLREELEKRAIVLRRIRTRKLSSIFTRSMGRRGSRN